MRIAVVIWGLSVSTGLMAQTRLTLRQAEETALRNHPRISAARNRADAAAQVPLEIRANSLPLISGNVTGAGALDRSRLAAGGLNNPIVYNRFALGVTMSQMITDFGRNRELTASARSRAEAQRQLIEATRGDIVVQTGRAFYAVLGARATLKVAEQTVADRQLLAGQVSALAKAGLKSTLDVSFANVSVSEAKLLLEAGKNGVQAAEASLAEALGAPPQERFELVDEAVSSPMLDDLKAMVDEAIAKRPELASLRLESSAAEQFATAEGRLRLPTISALTTVGVLPSHVSEIRGNWAAGGVNMNIPVFNGRAFAARKAQADFQLKEARDRIKDAELHITREVRVAYWNALTASQRVGLTAELLAQARLALELAQSRYDLGLSSIVELSQAQLSLTNAELAGASARFEYLSRRSELSYQLGANR